MTNKSFMHAYRRISFSCLIICVLVVYPVPGQDINAGNHHFDLSEQYIDAGQYDSAYEEASRAYEQYVQSGFKKGIGKALLQMGMANQFRKHFKEALDIYLKAQAILEAEMSDAELTELGLYNRLGGVYTDLGYRYEGRQYLEKAYDLCQLYSSEDSSGTAAVHYNLGLSSIYYGETRLALQHFLLALPVYIREYGENGARVAQLYNNVGILYRDLGEYDRAMEYYERAVSIHRNNEGDHYWNLAYPYLGMATVLENVGDSARARHYHQLVLELCRQNQEKLIRVESITHGAIAIHYAGVGAFEKSLAHANTAIEIMKENYRPDHPRMSDYYMIIGDVYRQKGSFVQAEKWYGRVIDNIHLAYGEQHPTIARVYQKLANMQSEVGSFADAHKSIDDGILSLLMDDGVGAKVDNVLDAKIYLGLVVERAEVYVRSSKSSTTRERDRRLALEEFEKASLIIDHIRRGYLSEEAKLFLQSNAVQIYEKALAVAYDLYVQDSDVDMLDRAFYFMEKSKASILSESLQSHLLKEVKGIPSSLLETESNLARRIKTLQIGLQESTGHGRDSLRRLVFNAKVRADSLQAVIQRRYPNYHDLKYDVGVPSLVEVQRKLRSGSSALSYFEGDSLWYVLAIGPSRAELRRITKTQLPDKVVAQFLQLVRDPGSSEEQLRNLSRKLGMPLVFDLLQAFEGIDRLVIVPDGILGYVPFEALARSGDLAGSPDGYLIDQYAISYSPSMTLYEKRSQNGSSFDENYVGFAPRYSGQEIAMANNTYREDMTPLLGSLEEVRFVGNLFGGKTYLKEAASEQSFKQHAGSSRILHLAMHAIADDADPMHSRLLFGAPDEENDGSLNAYELYNLRLQSDLVVLSACNTGVGALKRGEGILSLSRAFMYAGSPKVVMSLWRAKDQPTAAIVRDFFVGISKGERPDAALRNAKLAYLRSADPLQAHPANWATFIVIGNGQELSIQARSLGVWIAGVALTLGVLAVIWVFWRRVNAASRSR